MNCSLGDNQHKNRGELTAIYPVHIVLGFHHPALQIAVSVLELYILF